MKSKTKSYLVVAFLFVGMLVTFAAFKPQQQQPQAKYSCTLSANEWQAVINSIIQPDDFSNNQKKQLVELIQKNLVADTTKKK